MGHEKAIEAARRVLKNRPAGSLSLEIDSATMATAVLAMHEELGRLGHLVCDAAERLDSIAKERDAAIARSDGAECLCIRLHDELYERAMDDDEIAMAEAIVDDMRERQGKP